MRGAAWGSVGEVRSSTIFPLGVSTFFLCSIASLADRHSPFPSSPSYGRDNTAEQLLLPGRGRSHGSDVPGARRLCAPSSARIFESPLFVVISPQHTDGLCSGLPSKQNPFCHLCSGSLRITAPLSQHHGNCTLEVAKEFS